MAENTKGQGNSSNEQGQNSENRNQDISNRGQSQGNQKQGSGKNFNSPDSREREDQSGLNQGRQDASSTRSGTTDINDEALTGGKRGNRTASSSGITNKRNVTGSDLDGQAS